MSASGKLGTIGAPSGSPFIAAKPLAASTSVPNPGRALPGPSWPQPEIRSRIRPGCHVLQDVPAEAHPLERPRDERLHHDVEPRHQLLEQLTALRDFRFSVMNRLFRA